VHHLGAGSDAHFTMGRHFILVWAKWKFLQL
jgi:hypothetical protein